MIRNEAFDCLNRGRLLLLKALQGREFDAGELSNILQRPRNFVNYNLGVLVAMGLVERKKALKKNIWRRALNTHRQVIRFQLSAAGQKAVEYFSLGAGLEGKNG